MAKVKNASRQHVPTEVIMSVGDLRVDSGLNVRMRQGSTVYGITVNKDGYDLPTIIGQILERGKILEPIWVSLRENGDRIPLRGNRRTLGGQAILADPNTPEEVRKELENTRVLLFKGLTLEEEREKIMDQNTKPFARSEIIRYAWSLRQNGQSFERIAVDNFEMWGQFGRNAATLSKLADIRNMPADKIDERRKAIKTWLRGTVDEYVLPAYDLGPTVQKACLLSEMLLDGLLTDQDERPYFYTTRQPQKRMSLLGKAREKDGSKWSPHLGGEAFNAQMLTFHNEDFPVDGQETPKPKPAKRPSIADLTIRRNVAKSSVARMAFSIAIGTVEEDFPTRDDSLSILESKESLFLQYGESIDANATMNVRDLLTQIFLRDNVIDFKQMLEKFCPEGTIVEPVPAETTDEEVIEPSDTEVPAETVAEDGTFPLA